MRPSPRSPHPLRPKSKRFQGEPLADFRPVAVSASFVESTVIDMSAKLAVTLVNWGAAPHKAVTVMVRGMSAAAAVRSVERGPLRFAARDGNLVVEVPLDDADMLLIDR